MIEKCPYCGSEDFYFSKKRAVFVCEDCDKTFTDRDVLTSQGKAAEAKGLDIFFSYGHDRNRLLVERMKRDLEARGHHVWIDTSEIKVGDHWRQEIINGLLNTAGVIAFLSEHSTRNPGVCLDELKIAVCIKGANIRTVLLESETMIKQPSTLSDIQWLDMSEWQEIKRSGDDVFEEWYTVKFAQLCASLEAADTAEFSGEIHTLKEELAPYLNSEKEYTLLAKPYYGRKWLEERIEQWQDQTGSKALIIYGRPGSGKSAFSVNYSHYNADVYGCFLCEWNREYTTNPHKFVRTLAFRLAAKLPDYRSLLLYQLSRNDCELDKMSPEALFEYLVGYPLNHLVDGHRETGLIIVDGLDEAEQGGENPLAQMFASCIQTMPRWIKFIFTSRPERNVSSWFHNCDSLDLVADVPSGYNDIMAFLLRALAEELQQVSNKLEIINQICALSEGVFQYAVTLVEDIKSGAVSLQDVNSFPRGLNEIYRTTVQRRFPSLSAYSQIKPFLEIMCISDTMPEELLIRVCGYSRYAYLMHLDSLGSLVTHHCEEDGLVKLRFTHKSYSDWFADEHRANRYYVDRRSGALRLARYASAVIDGAAGGIMEAKLLEHIRSHVGAYYLESGCYEELEQFLIAHAQELDPYWDVWDRFPSDWDHARLLDIFWQSQARDDYLNSLQREGNSARIRWILEQAKHRYGIEAFSRQLITIYIDIVHLAGEYTQAVKIAEDYLQLFSAEVIASDAFLSMLAVRRIHHAMFFKPAQKLIDEARELYTWVNPGFPKVYNELLFLLGGNLGVLSGDWEFSALWLEASEAFAEAHKLPDFKQRNTRKVADCLCAEGQLEQARALLCGSFTHPGRISSRYEAYLTGALGNVYMCMGSDDEALQCYETMLQYATAKGIVGWCAHGCLGIADVYFKLGNIREAIDFANRASRIYQRIRQEWGIIMSDALLSACESRMGSEPIRMACKRALARAQKLQYGSCVESITALCSGKTNYLKLFFL